jgi:hypothetical protein
MQRCAEGCSAALMDAALRLAEAVLRRAEAAMR